MVGASVAPVGLLDVGTRQRPLRIAGAHTSLQVVGRNRAQRSIADSHTSLQVVGRNRVQRGIAERLKRKKKKGSSIYNKTDDGPWKLGNDLCMTQTRHELEKSRKGQRVMKGEHSTIMKSVVFQEERASPLLYSKFRLLPNLPHR